MIEGENSEKIAQAHQPTTSADLLSPPAFPTAAWHSLYARYGDLVGRDPWHWAACHAVACARMHRHLTFQHAYPHFGMEYLLIVIRTGSGKTSAIRLAEHLLGPDTRRIINIQSGQALAEHLADVTWGSGRDSHLATTVSPHPCLLVEDEFTRLLTQASLPGSTLLEALNTLYDGPPSWRISRVFRNNPLTIPSPSLSLLASTTQLSFQAALKARLLSSGFLNRCLIFSFDGLRKSSFAPVYSPAKVSLLAQSLEEVLTPDKNMGEVRKLGGREGPNGEVVAQRRGRGRPRRPPLPPTLPLPLTDSRSPAVAQVPPQKQWNLGTPETPIADFYSPAALEIYEQWWQQASPITEDGPLAPWFARAQAHYHRIALCCCYYEHRTMIEPADAQCAAAVMDFSVASTTTLAQQGHLPDRDSSPWSQRTWAETWILDRLAEQPLSQRRLQQKCAKLTDGPVKWLAVKSALDDLLKRGLLYAYADGQEHLLRLATAPR